MGDSGVYCDGVTAHAFEFERGYSTINPGSSSGESKSMFPWLVSAGIANLFEATPFASSSSFETTTFVGLEAADRACLPFTLMRGRCAPLCLTAPRTRYETFEKARFPRLRLIFPAFFAIFFCVLAPLREVSWCTAVRDESAARRAGVQLTTP